MLRSFCSRYRAGEKRDMLDQLRDQRTKGVVSTSALGLGIDIGALSASILITYPDTLSKAWQMLGRAGRRGPGIQLFLVGASFLDQYWAEHPDEFLDRRRNLEEMIINPSAIPGDAQDPQKRGVLRTRFRKASRWTNDLGRSARMGYHSGLESRGTSFSARRKESPWCFRRLPVSGRFASSCRPMPSIPCWVSGSPESPTIGNPSRPFPCGMRCCRPSPCSR